MIDVPSEQQLCAFCKRVKDPVLDSLYGPFVNYDNNQRIVDGPLYFHIECLEINSYSYFDKTKNTHLGIGKAMEQLVQKKSYKCDRCLTKGATIKCITCNKFYHGYMCSLNCMIFLGNDYQCYECRNSHNYNELAPMEKQEYSQMCKAIPRDLFLMTTPPNNIYLPQMHDQVYYFF